MSLLSSPLTYREITGGGVAPQALGLPSAQENSFVAVQNTARGLQNVYTNPALHLQVLFTNQETPYKSNMVCPTGVPSVNNDCMCPGNPSGVPYRQSVPQYTASYMNSLFSPIQKDMMPPMTQAAKYLIVERSPCPMSSYKMMDATPLSQC